jgi:hypothetical protein
MRGLKAAIPLLRVLLRNPARSALTLYLSATFLIYFYCCAGLDNFERDLNGAIDNFGDVMWRAFTTLTAEIATLIISLFNLNRRDKRLSGPAYILPDRTLREQRQVGRPEVQEEGPDAGVLQAFRIHGEPVQPDAVIISLVFYHQKPVSLGIVYGRGTGTVGKAAFVHHLFSASAPAVAHKAVAALHQKNRGRKGGPQFHPRGNGKLPELAGTELR